MPHVAVVTGSHNPHPAIEDQLLIEALRNRNAVVAHTAWNDSNVEWSSFDIAIIRSTWDYTAQVDEFLAWSEAISHETQLINPADIIAWNADKHYLGELAANGVPVVPTSYVEVGHAWQTPDIDDYVIKPVFSGGGRNSGRFKKGRDDQAAQQLAESVLRPGCKIDLLDATLNNGRALIVQPYMPIDEAGETGIVVLGGVISHAINKQAVLVDGGGTTTQPGSRGDIGAGAWDDEQELVVKQILEHIPGGADRCPYIRVDVVRDGENNVRLMELELIEPQLFFAEAPGSADRLAEIILAI